MEKKKRVRETIYAKVKIQVVIGNVCVNVPLYPEVKGHPYFHKLKK